MAATTDELYQAALQSLEEWDLEKAEDLLRQIVEQDPKHAKAWNKLGVVFARKEDLRQAENCFNQAIEADPNLASPHSNLGNIYADRGWIDRAEKSYEKALFLDPGNPTATHNLGVLYRKSGEIGKGIDMMKQAYRADKKRYRRSKLGPDSDGKGIRWLLIGIVIIIILYFLNR